MNSYLSGVVVVGAAAAAVLAVSGADGLGREIEGVAGGSGGFLKGAAAQQPGLRRRLEVLRDRQVVAVVPVPERRNVVVVVVVAAAAHLPPPHHRLLNLPRFIFNNSIH